MGISLVAEEANYSTTFSPESGKDYAVTTPWGWDISISANGAIAEYKGPGLANAKSWDGVFYGVTCGGSVLGKAGVGVFTDSDWYGASIGIGAPVLPGPNFKWNPQAYYLLTSIDLEERLGRRLGLCACYAILAKMP